VQKNKQKEAEEEEQTSGCPAQTKSF